MNCRNTEQVAAATAMLSGLLAHRGVCSGARDRDALVSRPKRREAGRLEPCPTIAFARGQTVRHRRALSKTLKNSCLSDGWDSTVGAVVKDVAERRPDDQGAVGFSTIAAFKGLEADAIVLLDAVTTQPSSRYLTYVGASRARALLAILLDQEQSEEIVARYAEFGTSLVAPSDEKNLISRRGGGDGNV